MGRAQKKFSDDAGFIAGLLLIIRQTRSESENVIVVKGLLKEMEKMRLRNDHKDYVAYVSSKVYGRENRAKAFLMYQPRNAIMKMIRMIVSGHDDKSLDEHRKNLLNEMIGNRHNLKIQKQLREMNHAMYKRIRNGVEYARQEHNLNTDQIVSSKVDTLLHYSDSLKKNKPIEVKFKVIKKTRTKNREREGKKGSQKSQVKQRDILPPLK